MTPLTCSSSLSSHALILLIQLWTCGQILFQQSTSEGSGSPTAHCFHNMPQNDLDYEELTRILTDNFNILADEVQLLSDRKTILEHKLRFAHEQVSCSDSSFKDMSYFMMKHFSSRSGAANLQQRPTNTIYPEYF